MKTTLVDDGAILTHVFDGPVSAVELRKREGTLDDDSGYVLEAVFHYDIGQPRTLRATSCECCGGASWEFDDEPTQS